MKLSQKALNEIRESMRLRNMLSLELGRHYTTILRMLEENSENGLLTTVKALQIIESETGLTQSEILESVEA